MMELVTGETNLSHRMILLAELVELSEVCKQKVPSRQSVDIQWIKLLFVFANFGSREH